MPLRLIKDSLSAVTGVISIGGLIASAAITHYKVEENARNQARIDAACASEVKNLNSRVDLEHERMAEIREHLIKIESKLDSLKGH